MRTENAVAFLHRNSGWFPNSFWGLREFMAHFIPLGRQIVCVVLVGWTNDGDLIDHGDIESPQIESFGLLGVIGQQPNLFKPKILKNLQSHSVVSHIGFEPESMIGFYGVEALVLERISLKLLR
jgi:hypothetical protein